MLSFDPSTKRKAGATKVEIVTAHRLLAAVAQGERLDKRLWTKVALLSGGRWNSTALVGTPEQVAEALLDYHDLGVTTFLIRGFEPLEDAIDYAAASSRLGASSSPSGRPAHANRRDTEKPHDPVRAHRPCVREGQRDVVPAHPRGRRYLGTTLGAREVTLDYLAQVARAADACGYFGKLLPTGRSCKDSWIVASALAPMTERLRYLALYCRSDRA